MKIKFLIFSLLILNYSVVYCYSSDSSITVKFEYAEALYKLDMYKKALIHLTSLEKYNLPSEMKEKVLFFKSMCYYKTGALKLAVATLNELIRLNKHSRLLTENQAELIEIFKKANKVYPLKISASKQSDVSLKSRSSTNKIKREIKRKKRSHIKENKRIRVYNRYKKNSKNSNRKSFYTGVAMIGLLAVFLIAPPH